MTEEKRENNLRLEDGELEAAWWGRPAAAAPTLVLLHEGLGSVGLWRDFPAWLAGATGCGVFAWSRLGYGRSDGNPPPWPLDYLRREAAQGVRRVLDAAGIRRAVLIGHSDGASIAALYGANAMDPRIVGLVLIAPHFFTEAASLAPIAQAREAYQEGEFRTRLARYHDHVDHAFRGWNRAWLDPAFSRDFDLTEDLRRLDVSTLVVQGEDDPYGSVAQVEAVSRFSAGPVEVLLVPGARHAPHLEAAERVRPAIAGFVARVFPDEV